jgi:hypothetical protein
MRTQGWGRGAVARLMTPFNRRAAHASSPHLLRLCGCSSYSTVVSRLRRHFASSSSSPGQHLHFLPSLCFFLLASVSVQRQVIVVLPQRHHPLELASFGDSSPKLDHAGLNYDVLAWQNGRCSPFFHSRSGAHRMPCVEGFRCNSGCGSTRPISGFLMHKRFNGS